MSSKMQEVIAQYSNKDTREAGSFKILTFVSDFHALDGMDDVISVVEYAMKPGAKMTVIAESDIEDMPENVLVIYKGSASDEELAHAVFDEMFY